MIKTCLFACCILLGAAAGVSADIVEFYLTGAQGDGLLPGNISPPTASTGYGGIGSTGFYLDTDTQTLHVDVEWGSENGYGDLTGEVTMLHLHGPTPSMAPDNFGETSTVILVNLGNSLHFDSSGTGGSHIDDYFVSAQDIEYLLSGRTYINVHTEMYDTGEIRGYVLPVSSVPEPSAAGIAVLAMGLIASGSRKRIRFA